MFELYNLGQPIGFNMTKSKLSAIAKFFDKVAERYNQERNVKGGRLFNEYIELPATKSLLPKRTFKNSKVLDIGCGIGSYTKFFVERGAFVECSDISKNMLKITSENCKDYKTSIKLHHDKFENLKLQKGAFDIIVGGFMLSYFDDLEFAFKKVCSYLKDDGCAVFSMLHPVRLSVVRKSKSEFTISNYFDETDYSTDLDFGGEEIYLNKWNIEDISKAVKKAGLFIDEQLEPKPDLPVNNNNPKAKLYFSCPSVYVVKLKKRK